MSTRLYALPVGTRYSNSHTYDEAINEFVHGWQVFVQRRADGTLTGRRSFVNNEGVLCGVEIAEQERARALTRSATELLHELRMLNLDQNGEQKQNTPAWRIIAKAQGLS